MQATNLLTQLSGASAQAPARAAVQPQPDSGGARFSQALSREMDQRDAGGRPSPLAPQRTEPAPKPADKVQSRQAEKVQSKQPDKPQPAKRETDRAAQSGAAGQAEAAGEAEAASTPGQAGAAASGDDAAAEAAARAAELPVTDMLALVAGITQLQAQAPQASAPAAPPAGGAGPARATGPVPAADGEPGMIPAFAAMADGARATTAASSPAPGAPMASGGVAAGAPAPDKHMLPEAGASEPAAFGPALRERIESAQLKETPAPVAPGASAQSVTINMVQAASGATGERIPARVGTAAWDQQISQKVVFMLAGKDQSATLTLNPPDLGPVQVVLNVSNDQASVAFSANQLEVRQALENAMPKLREMLGESGIALGSATVDAGTPDQRQAPGERTAGSTREPKFGSAAGGPEAAAQPARPLRTATLPGRVDTFA